MGQPTDRDADLDSPQDAVPEPAETVEPAAPETASGPDAQRADASGDVAPVAPTPTDESTSASTDEPTGAPTDTAPDGPAPADHGPEGAGAAEPGPVPGATPAGDAPATGAATADASEAGSPAAGSRPEVASSEPLVTSESVAVPEQTAVTPERTAAQPTAASEQGSAVPDAASPAPASSSDAVDASPATHATPAAPADEAPAETRATTVTDADAGAPASAAHEPDAQDTPVESGPDASVAESPVAGASAPGGSTADPTEASGAPTSTTPDAPVAGAAESPALVGTPDGGPTAESSPRTVGAPGGSDADEADEEPYVPRVFAFDPDVPAVLVPAPGAQADAPAAPAAGTADREAPAPVAHTSVAPDSTTSDDTASNDTAADASSVSSATPDDPTSANRSTAATGGDPADERAAERTAIVPVVPTPADGPARPAGEGSDAVPDATQVIPPVDPWSRPAPVVRTSILSPASPDEPASPAPDAAGATAPTEAPAGAPAEGSGATASATAAGAAAPSAFTPVPPDDSREASPFEGFDEDGPRRGWARGLLWTGIAVLVLGGLYTGAQWFYSDKVPSGTSVAGVDVGGLSRTAAEDRLESELGPRAAEPITLAAGEASTTLDPATAGLTFDAAGTAEELTSFSMNPARLWQHLFGGKDAEPLVTVDDAALDAQVEALRGSLEIEPVDGAVQFVDGAPTSTPAADGSALVTDEVPATITESWLVTDGPVELPTEPVEPTITQDETDAALALAEKVVSAPVVVSVGGQSPELPPEALAAAASFAATDGVLTLTFDGPALVQSVVDRTNDLLTAADDAHFVFRDGVPVIEGGQPGTTIDPAAIATAVTTAASGDERTATVELVESDPEQSVAALEALGIKEKVSEFSTPVPNVPVRTANLQRGAEKVNGTLVKPGETFSLVDTLSPITLEGGYYAAGIVESGRHTEGVGGGLSQMATTTYNAGFFAGLEDVEHRPHSYWFERYPAGREATIFVGSIDMKFKNDTPYGVLMQSWVGGGQLHVAVWSTKYYDVETSSSGKSNVVQPTTVTHSGADCAPTPAGSPGFSITNYRKVYREGELVKDESYRWTYKPDNAVVCE
ncbi:VanW family protein [Cellulosimicrobium aquatile]|uniref:VanW family protein n=1 Tax=Cellulosimicrobium aquatile TaxID=1612203 RepID=UPI00198260C0|nr:VanW family protein [Cellulosimicrobium aquatile]